MAVYGGGMPPEQTRLSVFGLARGHLYLIRRIQNPRHFLKVFRPFPAYTAAFPPGFPEECDPVSVPVGDGFDVECHCQDLDMGTFVCNMVVCQIQW